MFKDAEFNRFTTLRGCVDSADLRRGSTADVVSEDHLSYGEVATMAAAAARGQFYLCTGIPGFRKINFKFLKFLLFEVSSWALALTALPQRW
jgi:hypothetical protein